MVQMRETAEEHELFGTILRLYLLLEKLRED